MDFELKVKLDEGWYEEIDFKEVVQDSCKRAVREYVRAQTLASLEKEHGIRLAVQKLIASNLAELEG